jgi:aspartate aminotransferase
MRRTDGVPQGMPPAHEDPVLADSTATGMAACGYWRRRGLPTEPAQVAVAPSARAMLLAVLSAAGGGVLLPRPSPSWHAEQAGLLGRPVRTVPVPAECGGVPDPVAFLETVRRARSDSQAPRVLVLSVADGCTGTAAPPELLHEVCEAAADEGLLIVSDETWRYTSHDPHDAVIVGPAEMQPAGPRAESGAVVVIAGAGSAAPTGAAAHAGIGTGGGGSVDTGAGAYAGIARFPAEGSGSELCARTRGVLSALGARLEGTADAAVAEALTEPAALRERRAAEARAAGARLTALHDALTEAGALCRPPRAARHLYADLEPLRPRLRARGIVDAAGLEAELTRRLGPYAEGGHRFGDDPGALRVRLAGDLLARDTADGARDTADGARHTADGARDGAPGARSVARVRASLKELTAERPQQARHGPNRPTEHGR